MRVLMFGWEFPPHINGGLGTACFGMTQALRKRHTDLIFVLPCTVDGNSSGDEHFRIVPVTEGVEEIQGTPQHSCRLERTQIRALQQYGMEIRYIDSLLRPYDRPEDYERRVHRVVVEEARQEQTRLVEEIQAGGQQGSRPLRGGYGPNLMEEVRRYGQLAAGIAARENFDVIHVHDWMTYPAGIMARAVSGKPLVAHIHATEYDRSPVINQTLADMESAGLHAADKVIAVSYRTKQTIMEHYGVPEEKIEVVHNAVARKKTDEPPLPETPLLQGEKHVLFLGRVTFQKGPEYFLEAARLVLEREKNVRFYMAGSGDMLPGLIRRAGQLRIGNRFHFTGFLNGEAVSRIFAMSDLYVMPSVSEPFGITPLEAMMHDVPVLLSRQSGVSEVLQHALKANFWDVRDMADKICAVLRYPALAATLVRNCREEMQSIRWENAADKLNSIYRALCARGVS